MVNVFDLAFNTFIYFRLGHTVQKKNCCLYSIIENGQYDAHNAKETLYDDLPIIPTELTSDTVDTISTDNDHTHVTRICIVSDTHDRHGVINIPKCDILIHAGDILMASRFLSLSGALNKYAEFNQWLGNQPAQVRIIVGGNHDKILEGLDEQRLSSLFSNAIYLCNSSTEQCGLRIFGTPFSTGISKNCAFQSPTFAGDTSTALDRVKGEEVDLLITHGICKEIGQTIKPTIAHISGHVHKNHGVRIVTADAVSDSSPRRWWDLCAPILDRKGYPCQLPIVVDLKGFGRRVKGLKQAKNSSRVEKSLSTSDTASAKFHETAAAISDGNM